jgi:hypothetical protein
MSQKQTIIDDIENMCRNGDAFDDDVVKVLKKLTCADLFVLHKAFKETYKIGHSRGFKETVANLKALTR